MTFTDLFIKKPVLAVVVSLFILLLGLRSYGELNVRQYPELQNAVINVSTAYIGADADLIQGFITAPLEREIASAEGIDYITSTSAAGVSTIQAFIRLDQDANTSLTEIAAKVNKMRGQLPTESEDPVVELQQGDTTAAMYLSFYSEVLDNSQITDYLVRVVEPKLATVPGVQRAQILGDRTFAMRVWMKPDRMAALQVTASDVYSALQRNNVLSAVGASRGEYVSVDLTARTDLRTPEEFRELVVRAEGDAIVRLRDVADVVLGSENYATSVIFNGEAATFMGIFVSPEANSLDVIAAVREVWDREIIPGLPEGLSAAVPYDSTEYIQDAIDEVVRTIIEAVLIVIVVIYLFLGSLRSVLIPAVTVPLSLVGVLFVMLLLGYTINLLTLLAMVLAIGIVVDDAIIVLENIHRHIEEGMKPLDAALRGARELAWPVVAMTTTLVAVYLPIGFQGGLTGTLFIEFAFTLAGAVLLSGVIALTLSPLMSARLLQAHDEDHKKGRFADWLDRSFATFERGYQRLLHSAMEMRTAIIGFGLLVVASCYFLAASLPSELAPNEDQGFILTIAETDPYTTLEYMERYTGELTRLGAETPEVANTFLLNGGFGGAPGGGATTSAVTGFVLAPWSERDRSTAEVMARSIQPAVNNIAGLQSVVIQPPALPSPGGNFPVDFVIKSTGSAEELQEVADAVMQRALASQRFIFLNTDLRIDKPRVDVQVDREKAALLGIDMATLSRDLGAMLGGGYANRFALDNRSYKVIPQVQRSDRLNPEQLENYYTRARDGRLIPMSTLVTLEETVQPRALKRFQQMNAVTIGGVPRPGVSVGDALAELEAAAEELLPNGYTIDYAGQSRQFTSEGAGFVTTLLFAIIIIYLVLAAQFESFTDPLIMLVTVPMAISGALIALALVGIWSGISQFALGGNPVDGGTINIYSQVGLVTLVGVISKHGILIVEFANTLMRDKGLSRRAAVEEAAAIRLRPVLMTTAALVLAMVPLLIASGPGATSRFSMGLVIAAGMSIGTLFTLFVLPAFYVLLGKEPAGGKAAAMPDDPRAATVM